MIYIGGKIERVKNVPIVHLTSNSETGGADNTGVSPIDVSIQAGNLSETPVVLGNDMVMTPKTVIHNLKASFVSISSTEKFTQLDESAIFEDEVGYAVKHQGTRNYFLRK